MTTARRGRTSSPPDPATDLAPGPALGPGLLLSLCLATILGLVACGNPGPADEVAGSVQDTGALPTGGATPATPATLGSGAADAQASAAHNLAGLQAELDRDTVEQYLAVITVMRETGDDMTAKLGLDPQRPATGTDDLGLDGRWKDLLAEHGFDQTGFMRTHGSVALAFGAVIVEQQVEQARSQLSPQQFEMMQQALGAAATPFGQVSDENKQLVTELLVEVKQAYGYQGP